MHELWNLTSEKFEINLFSCNCYKNLEKQWHSINDNRRFSSFRKMQCNRNWLMCLRGGSLKVQVKKSEQNSLRIISPSNTLLQHPVLFCMIMIATIWQQKKKKRPGVTRNSWHTITLNNMIFTGINKRQIVKCGRKQYGDFKQ